MSKKMRFSSSLQDDIESNILKCSGVATNITVNLSSNVSFDIIRKDDRTYSAKGGYDSKNLFGSFDISGVQLRQNAESICLQFIGQLDLGDNDTSGFTIGTKINYVMSLVITRYGIKGVYHIGMLPNMGFEQYGILELSYSLQKNVQNPFESWNIY